MNNANRLGSNIRALRVAFGETQEQLGEAIFVEKNTVSYYENGKREPNKKTLSAIAKHFMVSVEELIYDDLTSIGTITVDKNAFWKNLDIILPLVSSEKALENQNFKKAFDAHKHIYSGLQHLSFNELDFLDTCIEGYLEAVEDTNIEAEAAANFLGLWFFLKSIMKTPFILKSRPAMLMQIASRDEKARKILDNIDPSIEADAKAALNEIDNDEMEKTLSEMLTVVKRSKDWSDLGDYYLAIQYVWNLVKNDLDWGFNQRIGAEMMNTFASVKNPYAARFIQYSFIALFGTSSQSVDDK